MEGKSSFPVMPEMIFYIICDISTRYSVTMTMYCLYITHVYIFSQTKYKLKLALMHFQVTINSTAMTAP